MMFEINTYVLKRGLRKNVKKEEFFLCKDERFIEEITDIQYIEGMIEVLYYGEEIIGAKEWDLVDQLWLYFIDAFIQLKSQKSAEFFFPDQPLKVRMNNINGNILMFEVGRKKYSLPQEKFIQSMTEEAGSFFSILGFQYGLDRIHFLLK